MLSLTLISLVLTQCESLGRSNSNEVFYAYGFWNSCLSSLIPLFNQYLFSEHLQ